MAEASARGADPPGTLHTDVNAGDKPIEVMVVELKKAD